MRKIFADTEVAIAGESVHLLRDKHIAYLKKGLR